MKDETGCCGREGCGGVVVLAALLLALGLVGGGYLLSKGDYAPKVNVPSVSPNIYTTSAPPEHSISVSGTASKKVAPDLLTIQFRVQTESLTASASQSDNARVSADLLSKLKREGVNSSSIQTTSYSVQPVTKSVYRCENGSGYYSDCHYDYVVTGYKTVQILSVQLTDLTKSGELIDAASTTGINQTFVDYVQFRLKDETKRTLERSLLQDAANEAKTKAENIARGLGVTINGVVSSSESVRYPYYYDSYRSYAYESAPSAGSKTEISSGEVDVSATVTTSFKIA
jgi:uncharacterized protein YggE